MKLTPDTMLRPCDAAEYLGVSTSALRNWARENLIPFQLTAGGHRKYKISDLDKFYGSYKYFKQARSWR